MSLTKLFYGLPVRAYLCRLGSDRRAVSAVEYSMIALIIVLAIMGGLSTIGGELAGDFGRVSSGL